MTNLQSPKRSNILSSNGLAAISHPLASDEAISILKQGGNAIDAAIAASIMLSVVEPHTTGIGDDCFAIISMKGKGELNNSDLSIIFNKVKNHLVKI